MNDTDTSICNVDGKKMQLLTTKQLLRKVVRKANNKRNSKYVEASLLLAGGGRAAHYLVYNPEKKILYDTGIDDEECETTLDAFANDTPYGQPNARWVIWNN